MEALLLLPRHQLIQIDSCTAIERLLRWLGWLRQRGLSY